MVTGAKLSVDVLSKSEDFSFSGQENSQQVSAVDLLETKFERNFFHFLVQHFVGWTVQPPDIRL